MFWIVLFLCLMVAFLAWQLWQIKQTISTQPPVPPSLVVQGAKGIDKLEADTLYIWGLRCQGKQASRRHLEKRDGMTAHDWNKASALMNHLGLVAKQDLATYKAGARCISDYVAEQRNLMAQGVYVRPYFD